MYTQVPRLVDMNGPLPTTSYFNAEGKFVPVIKGVRNADQPAIYQKHNREGPYGIVFRIYSPSANLYYIGYTTFNLGFVEYGHKHSYRNKYETWLLAKNYDEQFYSERIVPPYLSYFDVLAFDDARFETLASIYDRENIINMLGIEAEDYDEGFDENRFSYIQMLLHLLKAKYLCMYRDTYGNNCVNRNQ